MGYGKMTQPVLVFSFTGIKHWESILKSKLGSNIGYVCDSNQRSVTIDHFYLV